ncbi:MAG TPA: hypothetical protein VFO27_00045, partial [Bryobacteraceae bacterium]|nr:hypothetical protein [Bryobacteraceae bacterium]
WLLGEYIKDEVPGEHPVKRFKMARQDANGNSSAERERWARVDELADRWERENERQRATGKL